MDLKRHKIKILDVAVDDISQTDAVDVILKMAKGQGRGRQVATVNPEFVMLAYRNEKFAQILAKSDLNVADGIGVAISKLILGGKEHDRITGVDLVEKICKKASENAVTIGFMGGFGDVAKRVAKRQANKYPSLKVLYAGPGVETIGGDLRLENGFNSLKRIDLLFVALGMGKQEFFIDKMRDKLNIGLYIGVGGAFDYLSGEKKRAPKFLQNIGLEWMWRLFLDPVRIWRMRVLPVFAVLVFLQFCKNKFFKK